MSDFGETLNDLLKEAKPPRSAYDSILDSIESMKRSIKKKEGK